MPLSPQPVCRRPGCACDAVGPHGLCAGHDLHYVRWRAWRDDLDRGDRADLEGDDDPLDGALADALDDLHRHLTPGPWDWEKPP